GARHQFLERVDAASTLVHQKRNIQRDRLLQAVDHAFHQGKDLPVDNLNLVHRQRDIVKGCTLTVGLRSHQSVVNLETVDFLVDAPVLVSKAAGSFHDLVDTLLRRLGETQALQIRLQYLVNSLGKYTAAHCYYRGNDCSCHLPTAAFAPFHGHSLTSGCKTYENSEENCAAIVNCTNDDRTELETPVLSASATSPPSSQRICFLTFSVYYICGRPTVRSSVVRRSL